MGRLTLSLFAVVMAILCVFIFTSTTMVATDDGNLIALPAAIEGPLLDNAMIPDLVTVPDAALAWVSTQERKLYTLVGINTASPPSRDFQTSVMVALSAYNTYRSVRGTDKLLTLPLRC